MVPMGYLAKRVIAKPQWLHSHGVSRLFSVSGCNSHNLTAGEAENELNPFSMLNSGDVAERIARQASTGADEARPFYYEAYDQQWNDHRQCWERWDLDGEPLPEVARPDRFTLEGFDIVSFSLGNQPECSLLSCSHLAERVTVNEHCLMSSLDEARALMTTEMLAGCEPGPYRIVAVYSLA